ncbi:MAG: tRNA (adenosine(37)-N6)-dimethylallyltransferase MiaA [Armatimonadetes bacterium]|nr:tRNA (adenosine(37)-N6)-dimethylallyltransferase MiaA [Armatimonadota bacterium]
MSGPKLVAIMGPTASGKSAIAESLAAQLDAQLISADAFQVYRGLDIGTNKPDSRSRYALIDIKYPADSYGAGEFVLDAVRVLENCWETRQNVVLVGGTGFYIRALLEGFDALYPPPPDGLREELATLSLEEALSRLDQVAPGTNVDRLNPIRVKRALERAESKSKPLKFEIPPFQVTKFGLDVPTSALDHNIKTRLIEMLNNGWIEEVRALSTQGFDPSCPAFRAIGYSEIYEFLESGSDCFEALSDSIFTSTRRYAKRQRAWLRKEPKLLWLDISEIGLPISKSIETILNQISK